MTADNKLTIKSKKTMDKLLNLSKNLQDYKTYVNEVTFYYTIADEMINLIGEMIRAFTDEGIPIPKLVTETEAYWKYVKTLIDNTIGSVNAINVDSKLQVEIRGYTKSEVEIVIKDYDKSIENQIDVTDNSIDGLFKAVAKTGSKIKDDEAKISKVFDVLFAGIQRGITAYQKGILSKMPKGTEEEKEAYLKKANGLRYAKMAVAVAALSNKFIGTDDFKDDGSFILKFLSEVGGETWGLIKDTYINDPMKFINKYSNSVSDSFFSSTQKKVAKIGRGFQVGSTIGNKLIPFLVDFIGEDNLVSIDIVDGKPSMYGALQNRVKIYSYHYYKNEEGVNTFDKKLIFDGYHLQGDEEYPIYTNSTDNFNLMHEMNVEVYLQQNHLFDDPERTPWEIGSTLNPSELYSVYIGNQKNQSKKVGFCAKRPWGAYTSALSSFATYRFDDTSDTSRNCLADEGFAWPHAVGGPVYEFVEYLDIDSPSSEHYKLKSLDTQVPVAEDFYKFYSGYNYTEGDSWSYGSENDITIFLYGYLTNRYTIQMPLYTKLEAITIGTENYADKDILTLSDFSLPNANKAVRYVWSFSDISGNTETLVPTIEHPFSYENYEANVAIYTEDGNIIYRTATVRRPLKSVIDVVESNTDYDNYALGEIISLSAQQSIGGNLIVWSIYNNDTGEEVFFSFDDRVDYEFISEGSYTITLHVEDEEIDEFVTEELNIIVKDSLKPKANAGADQTIVEGESVTLDGSASTDAGDRKIDFYSWYKDGQIVGGDSTLVVDDLAVGEHIFTLRVIAHDDDDSIFGAHEWDEDNITVIVQSDASVSPLENKVIYWTENVNSDYVVGTTYRHRYMLALYDDATCRRVNLNLDMDKENLDKKNSISGNSIYVPDQDSLQATSDCVWSNTDTALSLSFYGGANEIDIPLQDGSLQVNASMETMCDTVGDCKVDKISSITALDKDDISGKRIEVYGVKKLGLFSDFKGEVFTWNFYSDHKVKMYVEGNSTVQFEGNWSINGDDIDIINANGVKSYFPDNMNYQTVDSMDFASYIPGYISDITEVTIVDDVSLTNGLIAHYEFTNGFINSVNSMDESSKWENSENVIVNNGYLNLKNSYDGDPERYIKRTLDTSNSSKLIIEKKSKLIYQDNYTNMSTGIGNSYGESVSFRNSHYYYNNGDLSHQILVDNTNHFYIFNAWNNIDANNFEYLISDLLTPIWNAWFYEKITIDYINKNAIYEVSNDGISYDAVTVEQIQLNKDINTSIQLFVGDWASGSEHIIDYLKIYLDLADSNETVSFMDNFDNDELFNANWTKVTSSGCCGAGNPAESKVENGNLILTTNGGSDGYMGISDGSYFIPNNVNIAGDFTLEISLKELSRLRTDNYKDNSGIGIYLATTSDTRDSFLNLSIRGNHSGYFSGYSYNEYEGHRISGGGIFVDEFDLDKLYSLILKIQRIGNLFELSYRFDGETSWVKYSVTKDNIESVIPMISIGSGDGGMTRKNGSFSASVNYIKILQ